jgi:hypothetical protein
MGHVNNSYRYILDNDAENSSVNVVGRNSPGDDDETTAWTTPLWWAMKAVADNRDDARDLARLLLAKGARLADDDDEQGIVEGGVGTQLCIAARAVRDGMGCDMVGARDAMCRLLAQGEELAEDEVNEYQKYVDSAHEKWSVPTHKRDEDFRLQSTRRRGT